MILRAIAGGLVVIAPMVAWADPAAELPADPAAIPGDAPGEVIVVTGARAAAPRDASTAAITVIDRDQLAAAPQVLTDDLVRLAPGVGAFRRSSSAIADPSSQGLNLRGVGPSGVSRALVLRDGVPLNDPFGGWVYWRAISALAIERVELVPSGASALFGDFALGGALQLISRPITDRALDVVAAGGSLGTARVAARAADRLASGLGVELTAEALRSDGYTPIVADQRGAVDGPAHSSHASAGARAEYQRGASTWRGEAHGFRESLDAGTAYTTADVQTATYGAGWAWTGDTAAVTAQLFGGQQRFEQERARVAADRSTAASSATQRTLSNNQGAAATSTIRAAAHVIVIGGDAQRVAGTATDHLTPAMVVPETLIERQAGGTQRFAGIFASDTVQATSALSISAALRLDGWQNVDARSERVRGDGQVTAMPFDDASRTQLDPRLGALWQISRALAVRASGYRAFRAPTLNELYRPFQVGSVLTAANPALRPETLWGGELGAQLAVATVHAQATGFWNRLSDPISNVTLAAPLDGATRQRQNLGATRIFGLELELIWQPAAAWTARLAHTFSDGEVTSAPAQPMLVGKRLAQDPRNRTTASLAFHDDRIATIVGELRYLDRMFEDDLNTQPIGAVILIDARVERALAGGLAVFVAGQNLTDRRYLVGRAGIDTQGAPRTLELGVAYRLGVR